MEKLIDSLKSKIEVTGQKDEKGNQSYSGFCLRYSTGNNLWVAGYGTKIRPEGKYVGTGYTPIEAIDDFISKFPQYKI